MGKRKRTSRRTTIVDRAVRAGRRALKEAESRVPPDVRRQVERRMKDADKTARAAIKRLQTQVRRASTRADVNSVLKQIVALTKQARQIISGTATRPAASRRRTATTTRRTAAARTKKAAPARRTAATRKATTSRAAKPRRAASPRRRRTGGSRAVEPDEVMIVPVEVEEVEIVEVMEP